MQPVLVHHCRTCSYNTPVPYSASVFSQDNYCGHCGALAVGVNVLGAERQQADMQQEELASLFDKSLSFAPPPPVATPPTPPQEPQVPAKTPVPHPPPITYASQHYIHPTHVAKPQQEHRRTLLSAAELEAVLIRNGIDPSSLFPSQISLIQNGDDDQRLRLLELWRISPPEYGGHALANELGSWPETSLQQEEHMAKIRYERRMREQRASSAPAVQQTQVQQDDMDTESAAVRAVPSLLSTEPSEDYRQAEPYVLSGYEALAKRDYEQQAHATLEQNGQQNALRDSSRYNQATDPVYNAGSGLWEKQDTSIQDMENRYGAFQQMREGSFYPAAAMALNGLDEDMVM